MLERLHAEVQAATETCREALEAKVSDRRIRKKERGKKRSLHHGFSVFPCLDASTTISRPGLQAVIWGEGGV